MRISRKAGAVAVVAALAAAAFAIERWTRPVIDVPAQQAASPDLFPFVRSFTDTRPDGNIEAAAENDMVASAELVHLFDYYLAAIGEKPLAAVRAEIERELDQRLKPPANAEAKRLLARYLDYKRALVDVEKNLQQAGASVNGLRDRFAAMQETRRNFFSERELAAMFAESDAYDLDAIARVEISQDASLTPEQKRARLAELDAAMPADMREAKEAPYSIARVEEAVQKMRAQAASDDDIYRMRAAALSPEAAARLAQVDQEEQAWNARIASYLGEREALLASMQRTTPGERQAAISQLRQNRFTPDEQKRLPAFEPRDGY